MTSRQAQPPLVSVYITTRNRATLLRRAIESVLYQSHPCLELIVVDDGSSDETIHVVEVAQGQLGRGREMVYIRNPVSRGAPASRNQAINISKGEFITGLDDDDEFLPDRIQIFLDNYQDEVSCLSTCLVERGRSYRMPVHQPRQYIDSTRIRYKNFVGNQIFTRTERLRELGGFDEEMKAWQDYDLWLRLIDRYGPALKLPSCTYVLDRSDEVDRITTSDNASVGYEQFLAKHRSSMTPLQLRHQVINDLHNRSVRISIMELFRLFERDTAARLVALMFKAYWPWLYRVLVKSHMRLSSSTRKG